MTVTDANLLLGRLNPDYFLAGRMRLDAVAGARTRWRRSASRSASAPLELAASIVEIANENMASAIKMVSLERGHDPRRFSLLAFGGAGPLHAAAVARVARHPEGDRAAVPRRLLGARPAARRHPRRQGLDAGVPLERRRRGARQPAVRADHASARSAELRQEGFAGEPEIRRAINMRYFGQNYEHEVEIDGGELDDAALERAFRRFDELHADALRLRDRAAR